MYAKKKEITLLQVNDKTIQYFLNLLFKSDQIK